VETALDSASQQKDLLVQEQVAAEHALCKELKVVFDAADEDGSGLMTAMEMESFMNNERIKAHMRALDIDFNQATGLFRLLDADNSGHVEAEEFIMGCMRLKGPAKSVDVASLMYETKKMVRYIRAAVQELKVDSSLMHFVARDVRHTHETIAAHEQGLKLAAGTTLAHEQGLKLAADTTQSSLVADGRIEHF